MFRAHYIQKGLTEIFYKLDKTNSFHTFLERFKDKMVIKSITKELADNKTTKKLEKSFKTEIVWRNVVLMLFLHIFAIYGYCISIANAKVQTWIFGYIIALSSSIGIQAGRN